MTQKFAASGVMSQKAAMLGALCVVCVLGTALRFNTLSTVVMSQPSQGTTALTLPSRGLSNLGPHRGCAKVVKGREYLCRNRMTQFEHGKEIARTDCTMNGVPVPSDLNTRRAGTVPDFWLSFSRAIESKIDFSGPFGYVYEGTILNVAGVLLEQGRQCGADTIVMDLGGNVGWYTNYLTSLGCRTVTVEAQDFATVMLNSTIAQNLRDPAACSEVYHRAITGSSSSMVHMIVNRPRQLAGAGRGGNTHAVSNPKQTKEKTKPLRGIAVDQMMLEESQFVKDTLALGYPVVRIPFVKIDVEGSELPALQGLANLIASGKFEVGTIMTEFHPHEWAERTGHTLQAGANIITSFLDRGFCLREIMYTECCKGPYLKKLDRACCQGSSPQSWPNWIDLDDIPRDLLGPPRHKKDLLRTLKDVVAGKVRSLNDHYLSKGPLCSL